MVWEYAKVFANSNFFVAFVSACAGAFGGALGAQFISEKSRCKEDLQKEIRNTNSAIMVAFGICNSYLMLKDKIVNPIKATFDRQKLDLAAFDKETGTVLSGENPVFKFQADFRTITPLSIRTDLVRTLAFEKISLNGRPLALVDVLTQTIFSLHTLIEKRNKLIENYLLRRSLSDQVLVQRYFGQPDDDGHVDTNYPDSLEGIYSLTDECIFFSKLLCDDLTAHGEKLAERYKKTISKKDVPIINQVNFEKSEREGLFPDPVSFADWTTRFVK